LFLYAFLVLSPCPWTPDLYPLCLHDALPILSRPALGPAGLRGRAAPHGDADPRRRGRPGAAPARPAVRQRPVGTTTPPSSSATIDRKSTRLNSSHQIISYAVFSLKKKKAPAT